MYLSNEGILMILLVGLIAGWLAGKIVRGTGIGLIGDMAIGIVGAFIASWLLPRLRHHAALHQRLCALAVHPLPARKQRSRGSPASGMRYFSGNRMLPSRTRAY